MCQPTVILYSTVPFLVVAGNQVVIDEVPQMTVRLDHDAVDGTPMARFLADLNTAIESAGGL
ncbi:MAG: 2-oxo acid dehydrogenase subunit E2 [Candidatus Aminicenantes bacterium]|nr:2-oxo acid dehydrogenase subunit E2 [Candidatus Aminicenantes bacterium]